MKVFVFLSLFVCLLNLSVVLCNHWWQDSWGKFGYKVKVHHPSIHGGWGWKHVGPSKGWVIFHDTHKKSPKGWHDHGWKKEKHHKKHHHKKEKHWW